jgi:hypothetical protein
MSDAMNRHLAVIKAAGFRLSLDECRRRAV